MKGKPGADFRDFFAVLWRQRAGRILLILAGVLLLAAAGAFVGIYLEGPAAAHNAQQLLVGYQEAVDSAQTAQMPQDGAPEAAAASTAASVPVPAEIDGYQVIGVLTLEKTAQTLPVISETSQQALKVSVCWYQGAMPGETGNMVITGHDYASGAHFGQLAKLTAGDRVTFATPEQAYAYEVYDTEIIRPDQPEKLDEYEGDTVLTLLTCTSHGNRRLVVRCKPAQAAGR